MALVKCVTLLLISSWCSGNIDYTLLSQEANRLKISTFLNHTRTRMHYQTLYNKLLYNLTVPLQLNRKSSGRRVVAGQNTSISCIPWQVSLREKTSAICGGSIITRSWIITAAHCLIRAKPSDITVRLGSSWKTHGGQMYDVENYLVHPGYLTTTKVNDVGLVSLYAPLVFSAKILPIPLVGRAERIRADEDTVISGWGRLKEKGPSAKYLQASTIKTIAMKLCRWSGLDRNAIDPDSMFCAGSFVQGSSDACQGDSGGPIVSKGVLIGVVSWGLGCARGNFPGVYSRLSSPAIWDWIQEHTIGDSNSSLLTESYNSKRAGNEASEEGLSNF